jgi:hypothetical protein
MTTQRRLLLPLSLAWVVTHLPLVTQASSSAAPPPQVPSVSINSLPLEDESSATARIEYVRETLHQRYDYVQSGKRAMDFARWVQRELGGNTLVFSMHGLDVDLSPIRQEDEHPDNNHNFTTATEHQPSSNGNGAAVTSVSRTANGHSPFSPNMMNLDIPPHVATESVSSHNYDSKPTMTNHHQQQQQVLEYDYEPPSMFQLLFRACRLGFHFFPVISTTGLALVFPTFRNKTWYRWMASCLADGGPAFIKWGQWASTRNDMFPDGLCDALTLLHNSAPAHDWSITQATLEASLGIPPNTLLQVFESVDTKPLASGSIAQIHKAVLRPPTSFQPSSHISNNHHNNNHHNNHHNHKNHHASVSSATPPPPPPPRTVAIKVRHPKVAKLIDMDFRIMTIWARIFDCIPTLSWLHIRETVEQFSHTMAAQAHLHVEAYHLEIFNYNFQKWPQVRFPRPMYANAAVIIESFEPGQIVTDILDMYDAAATAVVTQDIMMASTADVTNNNKPSVSIPDADDNHHKEDGGKLKPTIVSDAVQNKEHKGYPDMPIDMVQFIVTTGLSVYLKMLLVDNVMVRW